MNGTVLKKNNVDKYVSFVDKIVHTYLPNKHENLDLHKLVKLYQLHRHPKTCHKYRNHGCRFHFGKLFSNQTIAAKPFQSDMSGNMKHPVFNKRKDVLSKVKDYINNHLNPAKASYYDSSRDTFMNLKSVSEVLEIINVTEEEYKSALPISDDQEFQLHLKPKRVK